MQTAEKAAAFSVLHERTAKCRSDIYNLQKNQKNPIFSKKPLDKRRSVRYNTHKERRAADGGANTSLS